jgi:hypothetical protein
MTNSNNKEQKSNANQLSNFNENIGNTQVLYGIDNVINTELQFYSKTRGKIDTCMNYTRPPLAIEIDTVKKAFVDAKNRGVKLRYLTDITSENIAYCRVNVYSRRAKTLRRNKREFYVK